MSKDQLISELRKALEPFANEPLKDEVQSPVSDSEMDRRILAARAAMELTSEPAPSIH